MRIDIVTLFPEMFAGPFGDSIIKRARENGILDIRFTQLRDFSEDKHRHVDDTPFGGGSGMVLKPEPMFRAVRSLTEEPPNAARAAHGSRGDALYPEQGKRAFPV